MYRTTLALLFTILCATFPTRAEENFSPVGWATCASTDSDGDFDLTGGNNGSIIVLKNDGTDMHNSILQAIKTHDIIVFDGSEGDFVITNYIPLQSINNKTFIGVNDACFRTSWTIPDEVRTMLDDMDVKSLSQNAADNLGGTLSNGIYVAELGELTIRQALIDKYGDRNEPYRYSGIFSLNGCSNIIIRNLSFTGPGSIDVGGADLLTLNTSNHIWVDHCRFTDGMDGNLDVVNNSDFITISDCHFRYTDLSYNHPLSCLNSGTKITDGSPQKNNVSWIRCFWDEGCGGRMPFTTLGIHHILNCYWDCTRGTCIDAHDLSKLLIEESYFTSKPKSPLAVRDNNVIFDWRGSVIEGKSTPASTGTVTVPYSYTSWQVWDVPEKIKNVGPTLKDPISRELSSYPEALDFGTRYEGYPIEAKFNLAAFGSLTPSHVTLSAPEGILLSLDPDGEYLPTLRLEAQDNIWLHSDIYLKASFDTPGTIEKFIDVSSPIHSFTIPVSASIAPLEGDRIEAALVWSPDQNAPGGMTAHTETPDLFSSTSLELGDMIYLHSSKKIGSATFALYNPTEAIPAFLHENCVLSFDAALSPDYIFIPKSIRIDASRVGTNMCNIDVAYTPDSEPTEKLLTGFQPNRADNSPAFSEIEIPLPLTGIKKSLNLKIYLYNMLANKQLALGKVMIEGDAYAQRSSIDLIAGDLDQNFTPRYYDLMGRPVSHPHPGTPYILVGGNQKAQIVIYR